jgi:hypothetical protein
MDSPGHPEEMCLLLLAVVLLIACSVERSRHVATLAGMGAAVAGLTLTKVNIGVFVGGSMALTLLSVTARGMWTRLATRVVTAALLLLPLIVEVSLFDFWWVKLYILFAVPVIGAALLTQPIMPRRDMLQPADWLIIAAGGSLVCITGVGGMMLAGSSGNAILYAILLQDAQFLCSWYIPLDVGRTGVLVALISLLAALAYVIARSRQRRIAFPIAILKFGFVLTALASFGSPQWAYLLLVPFCWLFSVQPAGLPQPYAVARWMASLIGGVMSLYPFPVAGHQVTIGTLLPIMMVPVLTCDVIQTVQQRTVDARLPDAWRIGALSLIVVLAIGVAATLASARAYLRGVPLDLPGTNLIRVAQERENDLQWVTAQLRTCASSYSVPGLWSFAFWTGHVPPSGLANNDVLGLIQPAQQGEIVAVLSRLPDLCVVYNPSYLERFDRGQIAADPPLLHYIQADFSIAAERNGFFIMKRRDSPP